MVKDFEILMENLEEDKIASLQFGGSSEFHVKLGGYIDISSGFMGKGASTHFWTGEVNRNNIPIAWYFNPQKEINDKVYVGKGYEFYVRCIKE